MKFLTPILFLFTSLCFSQSIYVFKLTKEVSNDGNHLELGVERHNGPNYNSKDVTINVVNHSNLFNEKELILNFSEEQHPPINVYSYRERNGFENQFEPIFDVKFGFSDLDSTLSNGEVSNSLFNSFSNFDIKLFPGEGEMFGYSSLCYLFFVFPESSSSLSNYKTLDKEFNLYPNPTNDILNIDIEDYKSSELFNISGQSILKTDEKSLNLSKFNNGVYFLTIEKNDGIKSKGIKVLKE